MYIQEEVLDLVLADSDDEKSESPDKFVVDVKDEYDQSISLPDSTTNFPAMKENQWFSLMGDLNEVSISYFYA